MRGSLLVTAACVGISSLSAQSTPAWWKYVPPNSTSIVGIHWQAAQSTLFAPALRDELRELGLAEITALPGVEQILLASPSMLAIVSGHFSSADLKRKFAVISDTLLLVGDSSAIEEAITRVSKPKSRSHSPLLARASRYANEDLWVVASRLPDSLANLFVPLDNEATAFEGSVSLWDGLHLVAAIEQADLTRAQALADDLETELDEHPAMADGTEITIQRSSVLVRMDLNEQQLAASLRLPVSTVTTNVSPPLSPPAPFPPAVIPSQTVKILGLTTGTREIPLGR
jgi:hypothetical protein